MTDFDAYSRKRLALLWTVAACLMVGLTVLLVYKQLRGDSPVPEGWIATNEQMNVLLHEVSRVTAPPGNKHDLAAPNEPATQNPTVSEPAKQSQQEQSVMPSPAGKPSAASQSDTRQGGFPVNLNTANLEQLMSLPGIGDSKAKAIMAYREQNGRYSDIQQLLNVKGIGEKTLETLKPLITVTE